MNGASGGGHDLLVGGNDIVSGGGGDTDGDLNDSAGGAQDLLNLRDYAGLDSFADLTGFITQSVADTVIDLGAAGRGARLDTITLLNTTGTDFGAGELLF